MVRHRLASGQSCQSPKPLHSPPSSGEFFYAARATGATWLIVSSFVGRLLAIYRRRRFAADARCRTISSICATSTRPFSRTCATPEADNFTGKPVDGYEAPECVLVRQAAEALKKVQADLRGKGLTLKVYDCYRPARAVAAFVAWSKLPDDPTCQGDVVSQSDQRRPVPRLHRHALGPFARRDARSHSWCRSMRR